MKVYYSLDQMPKMSNLVITQGTFDGVHLGHQKVLSMVKQTAIEKGGQSMLITFYPHPRLVLYPNDNTLRILSSIGEKIRLVEKAGIDFMLVLPFTDEISKLSPLEFVRNVLVETLKINTIIVGYDHRFGKNREGSFPDLLTFGEMFDFSVLEIPASEIENIAISSTRIRRALLNGDLQLSNDLLGHLYNIEGTVVHGRKLGRQLGYPTANIQTTESFKLIPQNGVYAALCKIGKEKFKGAVNIGNNPTIDGKGFSIEIHLFEFDKDIYDLNVELELVQFLRHEQRFESIQELTEQISKDVEAAKTILAAY